MIADARKLPFESEAFDAVIAIEVIEHLDRPAELVKEARRVLSRNGTLYIKTPNRWTHDLYQVMKRNLRDSRGGDPNVMTKSRLENLLTNHGFTPHFMKGGLVQYQSKKLPSLASIILRQAPFRKLPTPLQPSIYVAAKKV